jgi:hypothetical protein
MQTMSNQANTLKDHFPFTRAGEMFLTRGAQDRRERQSEKSKSQN